MLSQAEDLVPTASPMEISSAFHRLKYATYWTIREYRCWRVCWPEDIWINRLAAVYAWCCWRLSTVTDDTPTETDSDRRHRLRWAHLHASQALALPTFMRTQREWEVRLRLRRTELKLLLAAADEQIMNELFHVAIAAAPDYQ